MELAAFVDRDGVINQSHFVDGVPSPPKSIQDVKIIEGVKQAIEILKSHAIVPVVITNQPDVARGTISKNDVLAINKYIGLHTGIEYFYTCFHDDSSFCLCRKPSPGLIFEASKDLDLNVSKSFLVGDRWRDIEAGQKAGCKCFFIDYQYPEKQPTPPFIRVTSLISAVEIIIGGKNGMEQ
jgi:D-glycero-D-manno-heptose 1,7-bisphosphate phosphatase